MKVTASPQKAPSPIKRDVKGKGKALEAIQLSTTEEDDDDDDDIVEDSQNPYPVLGSRDLFFPIVKASPKMPAVASGAFYSPSNKATSPKLASPSKICPSSTKGTSTPRASSATPAVFSPASTSSRRSGRAATAVTKQNIYKSLHSPYGADMDTYLQQAAGPSSSRSRQPTPKVGARATRSTSVAAQSSTKLTREALASLSPNPPTPPRTPLRNTTSTSGRYYREPSGSPLSSLASTPKKPTSLKGARKPVAKPNFYLDLLVRNARRGPVLRRERSQTVPDLDERESDDDGMEVDQDDGATEKGPANTRKQDNIDGTLTDSASGSSSSSDSADESEDDGLALALARAKARREAGTSLLPTSDAGHPSSSTAAALPTSPDIRRSSRTAAKDEEKAMQQEREKQAKEKAKMKIEMGMMDLDRGAQGRLGIAALQRERLERERTGKSADWLEAAKLLAEGGGDEYVSLFEFALSLRRLLTFAITGLGYLLHRRGQGPHHRLRQARGPRLRRRQRRGRPRRGVRRFRRIASEARGEAGGSPSR